MRITMVALTALLMLTVMAPAHADPSGIVLAAPTTGTPYKVEGDASDAYDKSFPFDLTGTDAGPVTVTATGDEGTTAYPATQTVDPGTDPHGQVHVRATPGLHTLTLTFTAVGAEPETRTYQLWAAGGAPIPGTGDLTGVRWAFDGGYSYDGRYTQRHDAVWFVDDRWAFLGFPRHGLPSCTATTAGCVRYWYDESGSGAIRLGDDVIAKAWSGGIVLDGRGGWQDDEMWGRETYDDRLGFYGEGKRLDGAWRFADRSAMAGANGVTLRLDRDGTFRFRQVRFEGRPLVRSGHYRMDRLGALRLRGAWGHQTVTFAPCLTDAGVKAPGTCVVASFTQTDGRWSGGVLTPVR